MPLRNLSCDGPTTKLLPTVQQLNNLEVNAQNQFLYLPNKFNNIYNMISTQSLQSTDDGSGGKKKKKKRKRGRQKKREKKQKQLMYQQYQYGPAKG